MITRLNHINVRERMTRIQLNECKEKKLLQSHQSDFYSSLGIIYPRNFSSLDDIKSHFLPCSLSHFLLEIYNSLSILIYRDKKGQLRHLICFLCNNSTAGAIIPLTFNSKIVKLVSSISNDITINDSTRFVLATIGKRSYGVYIVDCSSLA